MHIREFQFVNLLWMHGTWIVAHGKQQEQDEGKDRAAKRKSQESSSWNSTMDSHTACGLIHTYLYYSCSAATNIHSRLAEKMYQDLQL
jgi:hypothetical protein